MSRRRRTCCVAAAGLALTGLTGAGAPAAQARIPIRIGIGDQQAAMFDQAAFRRAHFRHVRYVIAWNAMQNADQLERARVYVQKARAQHIAVLLHMSTDD